MHQVAELRSKVERLGENDVGPESDFEYHSACISINEGYRLVEELTSPGTEFCAVGVSHHNLGGKPSQL
jgi:hypothetical protein